MTNLTVSDGLGSSTGAAAHVHSRDHGLGNGGALRAWEKPYPAQEQRTLLSRTMIFAPPFTLWSKWQSPVPPGSEIPRGGSLQATEV